MNVVYFISPVGSDPKYNEKRVVLKSIADECGVEFFFPLDRHKLFSVDNAVADLRKAWFVIADLSLERPSCYFEVGLAQAVGAPVSFLATSGTPIHQVGGANNYTSYSDLPSYGQAVRHLIVKRWEKPAS